MGIGRGSKRLYRSPIIGRFEITGLGISLWISGFLSCFFPPKTNECHHPFGPDFYSYWAKSTVFVFFKETKTSPPQFNKSTKFYKNLLQTHKTYKEMYWSGTKAASLHFFVKIGKLSQGVPWPYFYEFVTDYNETSHTS